MTDLLVLLDGGRQGGPSARLVRSLITEESATVASIQIPGISNDCLDRGEFLSYHWQHGVDLASIDPEFRLRDLLLVKSPNRESRLNFVLLHLWNWPSSTYEIDAVRIPYDTWADPRNNPLGKNPGNIWSFSEPLNDRGRGKQTRLFREMASETVAGGLLELDGIERLVRGHTEVGDAVHVWATDSDQAKIQALVEDLGRISHQLPGGGPDLSREVTYPVKMYPSQPLPGGKEFEELRREELSPSDAEARFFICDCRSAILHLPSGSIEDVVTSPPYNIGYDPFNVPKPDPSTGQVRSPIRKGYVDELSLGQYNHLLRSTFSSIDDKLNPDSADVFVNLKNNYHGADCRPPFWLLQLIPSDWKFTDLLVWRYDISYDPARNKYKPYYEWLFRFTKGRISRRRGHRFLQDYYIPILKGNSRERQELTHPSIYPMELVKTCLRESHHSGLVLDPFLGSGTTLAAAREMRRPSVGFEIDDKYRGDVEKRLARATVPAAT